MAQTCGDVAPELAGARGPGQRQGLGRRVGVGAHADRGPGHAAAERRARRSVVGPTRARSAPGRGSASRTTRPRRSVLPAAGRAARPARRAPRPGSRPTRRRRHPPVGGRAVEADPRARSRRVVSGMAGDASSADDAQRLEGARRAPRRPPVPGSDFQGSVGLELGVGRARSAATWPRAPRGGRSAPRPPRRRHERPPRPAASGLSGREPGRSRRTWSRRRSPPGRPGCPGCWPDRRCSATTMPS